MNSDVFFTALLQYFILGQSIATSEIMAMIGCYFGIIIMVYDTSDTSPSYSLTLGVVWSLIAAASIAVGSILIYKMRELHYTVVVFWQGIFCVGFFLVCSGVMSLFIMARCLMSLTGMSRNGIMQR